MADSKMQYKMMARRPGDLARAFSVCSGWSKLGAEANERVLSCFQGNEQLGHRFFLTLAPMASFKFRLEEATAQGIVAMREKTQEVLLAKPVRGPLLTVDLAPPVDGYMAYTFMYTFSGSLFPSCECFAVMSLGFIYQKENLALLNHGGLMI